MKSSGVLPLKVFEVQLRLIGRRLATRKVVSLASSKNRIRGMAKIQGMNVNSSLA